MYTRPRNRLCVLYMTYGSLLEAGDTDRAISHVYRASLLQPNNAETVSLLTEIQHRVSQWCL